jgi:hypothetical protein
VSNDIGPVIDEVYPLYVQVYERSKLHFERLTKEYFCRLGKAMPDKVRFFVWRRNGKAVAFGECLVHGDTMFAELLDVEVEGHQAVAKMQLRIVVSVHCSGTICIHSSSLIGPGRGTRSGKGGA